MLKRSFDFLGAAFGLFLFSPILVGIALLIKIDGGPVFYRGVRVGLHGRPFRIFKFRTMVANADKLGGSSTADDDPRITRVGKFLRKYKLDELPQLINVLKGDMSIVGPRPEVPSEVERYSYEHRRLLSVRPGLTDYASIRFHNEGEILKGHPDPHKAYRELIQPEKIRLGLAYVHAQSLWTDLKVIGLTIQTLLVTRSHYDRDRES